MRIPRRDFLKILGTTAVSAASLDWMGFAARAEMTPVESWVNSTCGQCPGGCGIRARVHQGQVKRIDGNPLSPVNRGGLCPNGQAGAAVLYDPDRFRSPLKRDGDEWVMVDWDRALTEVTEQLKKIREQGRAHAVAAVVGDLRGTLRETFARFLRAYGSPNLVDAGLFPPNPLAPDNALMTGVGQGQVFDLERAGFVLNLGGGIFEAARNPVEIGLAWGRLRSHKGLRSRLVYAGPRMGITAAKADQWVPIRPGTEGALALGVAHMIIRENLYDQEFVTSTCDGFLDWKDASGRTHSGFRSMVLRNYGPSQVAELTGVDADLIIRLARQFAGGKPSVAIGPESRGPGGLPLFDQMAILALNVLVGSLDVPGGLLTGWTPPVPRLPDYELDVAAKGTLGEPSIAAADPARYPLALSGPSGLAEALLTGKPYRVQALFLFQADPVFELPCGDDLAKALAQVPLIVSFDSFPTDSNRLAHWILPNHTYLERLEDVPHTTLQGYPLVGLRQPVVPPLYYTRHTGDVLLQLAAKIGGSTAAALPFQGFEEVLKAGMRSVYEANKGDVIGGRSEEAWTQVLEKTGWRAPFYRDFDEFWKLVRDRGGWWDPIYTHGEYARVLKTASGKFEFVPEALRKNTAYQDLRSEEGDRALMPHARVDEGRGDPAVYPLRLVVYPLPQLTRGDPNVAWLQDTAGFELDESWESWVEVNPVTAKELGLVDGEFAKVRAPRGEMRCRVRFYQGVRPEVVAIPFGFGKKAGGRWAEGIGSQVGSLLAVERDEATGQYLWHLTRVRVERA